MSTTRISDVIVPSEFTPYILANSLERTDFFKSGVFTRNAEIAAQLAAGAQSFTIPIWLDLGSTEADISSDDPAVDVATRKIGAAKQVVRKSFVNSAWSNMNLAAELSGDDPQNAIKQRVANFWARQMQHRIVATLKGIVANNVENNDADMIHPIASATTAGVSTRTTFSAEAVIDAANTLGDALNSLTAIAMHSATYTAALKNDLIQFLPDSQGRPIRTFRGLAVIVDDGLPVSPPDSASGQETTKYTTILFGAGALAGGMADPRVAPATEVFSNPAAGNGGGMQTLHSRVNLAVAPVGHTWNEGDIAGASPNWAELATGSHWARVLERKAVPIAFLIHN